MREKSIDSINMIPFIDIMLVLLVIVLMTATFIKTGVIKIHPPVVGSTEMPSTSVTVTIDKSGNYYFDGKMLSLPALANAMKPVAQGSEIVVEADKAAQVQPLAALMSMLRDKGYTKIGLQADVAQ